MTGRIAMGCGQKNFQLVWLCHQLLSGFLGKAHLPQVSSVSSVADDKCKASSLRVASKFDLFLQRFSQVCNKNLCRHVTLRNPPLSVLQATYDNGKIILKAEHDCVSSTGPLEALTHEGCMMYHLAGFCHTS